MLRVRSALGHRRSERTVLGRQRPPTDPRDPEALVWHEPAPARSLDPVCE